MQSTDYYTVLDGKFTNVDKLLAKDVTDDVLTELQDLAEPTPGDEDYAHVYGRVVMQRDFLQFTEPHFEGMFEALAEDSGRDFIDIYQWNSPDSITYYLPKGRKMVEIESLLGPMDSDSIKNIFDELETFFEPVEDAIDPGYVRIIRLNSDDLFEDEEHSEALTEMLRNNLSEGNERSMVIYQWTE